MHQVAQSADIYGAEYKRPAPAKTSTRGIDSVVFVQRLAERCPGIHVDIAGRQNIWTPRQDEFMGLFYWQKHICGMDRGIMPEHPEWEWTEEMVRVPVEVAARDDIPLLSLDGINCPDHQMATCGFAMRPTQSKVIKVGWRDTMQRVIRASLPGLTRLWLQSTFRVDLTNISDRSPRPLRQSWGA